MSRRSIIIWVLVAAIVVVIILMITNGRNSSSTQGNSESTSTGAILNSLGSTSSSSVPTVKTVVIRSTNYSFTPNNITIYFGDTVDLRVQSDGNHDFVINDFGISQKTPPGTTVIRFTPDRKGVFNFYCSVDGHRERGMTGTLTVK